MEPSEFPLFRDLEREELDNVTKAGHRRTFAPDARIMEQDSSANSLFLLFAGSVRVVIEQRNREEELATIQAPAVIGEMEWLTGGERSATVIAASDVQALELTFEALNARLAVGCTGTYKMIHGLAKVVASRLDAVNKKLAELHAGNPGSRDLQALKAKLFAEWTI